MNQQTTSSLDGVGLVWRYLDWPWTILVVCLLGLAASIFYSLQFRFDASADTLVVESDPDLALYDRIAAEFGGDDFLFLTFQPASHAPISKPALKQLQNITEALAEVPGVRNVFSVLDAPLLKSPPMSLSELATGFRTLQSVDVELALAQRELTQSPFFKELLITDDGSATAIKIDLARDEDMLSLMHERTLLRSLPDAKVDAQTLAQVELDYRLAREAYLLQRERLLADIRAIQLRFATAGTLHLGGVPMIAADMITYVKRDLIIFGGSVIGLMILVLAIFFRTLRWVVLPIASAALSVVYTVGLLGFLDWQATVVSSNFISLLGITAVSLTIHLVVHYRELQHTQPEMPHQERVLVTMQDKFAPCFFTALTTMAAFGSLTVSGIVPVAHFGWMMVMGIVISFLVTYSFFPAVLLLLNATKASSTLGNTNHFIRGLADFAQWRAWWVILFSAVLVVVAVFGIQRVSLDNRFAEYFAPETEIYQGMRYIDAHLGGTIPFDVVLAFPPYEAEVFDEDDDFGFAEEDEVYPERYWFSRGMLDRLERVHRFLEAQPQVGKVLSLTALEDFAKEFTEGRKLSSLEIVAILGAIPADLHKELIAPYASPITGQLRLTGRIREGGDAFDRELFRQQIEEFAVAEAAVKPQEVAVTGMMVLFNSMLKQLLASQVDTLSYVLLAVFVMFLVLLRSLRHALLGMIPNALAAALVIAAMGYAGIPLDMMTTTIAAICIGIGVDDTIHYLHRFRIEYARWGDPRVAVRFTHASVGRALFFTSVTVIVGFSVLYFSNFVPTVMFGIWAAVAMLLALLANLVLLPALLVVTHATRVPEPT